MVRLVPSGCKNRACTLASVTGLYSLSRTSTRSGTRVSSESTCLGVVTVTGPGVSVTR